MFKSQGDQKLPIINRLILKWAGSASLVFFTILLTPYVYKYIKAELYKCETFVSDYNSFTTSPNRAKEINMLTMVLVYEENRFTETTQENLSKAAAEMHSYCVARPNYSVSNIITMFKNTKDTLQYKQSIANLDKLYREKPESISQKDKNIAAQIIQQLK